MLPSLGCWSVTARPSFVATRGASLQGGFFMKAIVVAVSSFQKLLFLDADNIPAGDPTPMLQAPEFHATGALLWRDFWDASWAPDAPLVLGVAPEALPQHTHESGQMVLDKHKCAPAPAPPQPARCPCRRTPAFPDPGAAQTV